MVVDVLSIDLGPKIKCRCYFSLLIVKANLFAEIHIKTKLVVVKSVETGLNNLGSIS